MSVMCTSLYHKTKNSSLSVIVIIMYVVTWMKELTPTQADIPQEAVIPDLMLQFSSHFVCENHGKD